MLLSCFVHFAGQVLSTLLSGFVNSKICIRLHVAANLDVMEILNIMLYVEKKFINYPRHCINDPVGVNRDFGI